MLDAPQSVDPDGARVTTPRHERLPFATYRGDAPPAFAVVGRVASELAWPTTSTSVFAVNRAPRALAATRSATLPALRSMYPGHARVGVIDVRWTRPMDCREAQRIVR